MSGFNVFVFAGVELERALFLREEQRMSISTCSCPGPKNGRFCSQCGCRLPTLRTVSRFDHTLLPPLLRERVEAYGETLRVKGRLEELGTFLDGCFEGDCRVELNPRTPGDLILFRPPNQERIFVGRLLDWRSSQDRQPKERHDFPHPETDGLQMRLQGLGISTRPQLHIISFVW